MADFQGLNPSVGRAGRAQRSGLQTQHEKCAGPQTSFQLVTCCMLHAAIAMREEIQNRNRPLNLAGRNSFEIRKVFVDIFTMYDTTELDTTGFRIF